MTNDQKQHNHATAAGFASHEVVAQLTAGLEALKITSAAFQTRLDLISQRLDKSRKDMHRVRNDASTVTLQLALLAQDLKAANISLQNLNDLVLVGNAQQPLRERVTVLEQRIDDTDKWISGYDQQHQHDVRDLVKTTQEEKNHSKTTMVAIVFGVVGTIAALLGAVATYLAGK